MSDASVYTQQLSAIDLQIDGLLEQVEQQTENAEAAYEQLPKLMEQRTQILRALEQTPLWQDRQWLENTLALTQALGARADILRVESKNRIGRYHNSNKLAARYKQIYAGKG